MKGLNKNLLLLIPKTYLLQNTCKSILQTTNGIQNQGNMIFYYVLKNICRYYCWTKTKIIFFRDLNKFQNVKTE